MKNKYLQSPVAFILTCLSGVFMTSTHADPLPFVLEGTVVVSACGVLESEENKYVDLGRNSTRELRSVGSRSASHAISFELFDCPEGGNVSITLEGNRDLRDSELLAVNTGANTAENIAIELQNVNRERAPLGLPTTYVADQEGRVSTQFYAHYIVTQGQALPGIANAQATFRIEYD